MTDSSSASPPPPQERKKLKRQASVSSESTAASESRRKKKRSKDASPKEISGFRVSDESQKALAAKGITSFFPIQSKTYDAIYDGKHVVGRARTGTGKTLAFCLPAVERLIKKGAFSNASDQIATRAIILLPTRELAQQVAAELGLLQCGGRFGVTTLVGGVPEGPQLVSLRKSRHMIVGTPGRVLDFLNRNLLHLEKVKVVVLDEADRMLEMGFRDDVDAILGHLGQKAKPPQFLLFTATLPQWVSSIADRFMVKRERLVVDVVAEEVNAARAGSNGEDGAGDSSTIVHYAMLCAFSARPFILKDLFTLYGNSEGATQGIVFTRTKAQADQLAVDSSISSECQVLHGDIQQRQREKTLDAFRNNKFRILVATDVAARGLDVDGVSLVIQLEPPSDVDTFTHRAGRTGRAGRKGVNLVLFATPDAPYLKTIERATGITFKRVGVPQASHMQQALALKIADRLMTSDPTQDSDEVVAQLNGVAESLIESLGPSGAVSRLLQELTAVKNDPSQVISALSGRPGYKAFLLKYKKEGVSVNNKGYIWRTLRDAFGEGEPCIDQISYMVLLKDAKGAVFDVAEGTAGLQAFEKGLTEIAASPQHQKSFSIEPLAGELPELDDPLMKETATSWGNEGLRNPRQNIMRGRSNGDRRGGRGGGQFGRSYNRN